MVRSDPQRIARVRARNRGALAAFASLAGVATLVGCNAILGLDDYRAATGNVGDAGLDAPVDVLDASPDGPLPDPPGVSRATWAKWRMLPTSLSDGGELLAAAPTEGASDIQFDTPPRPLVFRKGAMLVATFEQALNYCKQFPGYRLPTRIELVSAIDYTKKGGEKLPTSLGAGGLSKLWTSSIRRPVTNPPEHWFVVLQSTEGSGLVKVGPPESAGVVCIKGVLP